MLRPYLSSGSEDYMPVRGLAVGGRTPFSRR